VRLSAGRRSVQPRRRSNQPVRTHTPNAPPRMPSSSTSHSIHRSRPCLARKAVATRPASCSQLCAPKSGIPRGHPRRPGQVRCSSRARHRPSVSGPAGRADAKAGEREEIGTSARVVQEEPGYGPDLQVSPASTRESKFRPVCASVRLSRRPGASRTYPASGTDHPDKALSWSVRSSGESARSADSAMARCPSDGKHGSALGSEA
jgi:hypothetical protein